MQYSPDSLIWLVYIAGPYRGNVEHNIEQARLRGLEVMDAALKAGTWVLAVVPHLLGKPLDTFGDDAYWLAATKQLMLSCNSVVMVPGWESSQGATEERATALACGLTVCDTLEDFQRYLSTACEC